MAKLRKSQSKMKNRIWRRKSLRRLLWWLRIWISQWISEISLNWEGNVICSLREFRTKSSMTSCSIFRPNGLKRLEGIRMKLQKRVINRSQSYWTPFKMSSSSSITWLSRRTFYHSSRSGTSTTFNWSSDSYTVSYTSSSTLKKKVFSKRFTASSAQNQSPASLAKKIWELPRSASTATSTFIVWVHSNWPSITRNLRIQTIQILILRMMSRNHRFKIRSPNTDSIRAASKCISAQVCLRTNSPDSKRWKNWTKTSMLLICNQMVLKG